jgi:hypothetical protein
MTDPRCSTKGLRFSDFTGGTKNLQCGRNTILLDKINKRHTMVTPVVKIEGFCRQPATHIWGCAVRSCFARLT